MKTIGLNIVITDPVSGEFTASEWIEQASKEIRLFDIEPAKFFDVFINRSQAKAFYVVR